MSFLENLELLAIKKMLEESAKECERQTRENLEKFGITATFNIELKVEGVDIDCFHKALSEQDAESTDTADFFNTITKTYKE